MRYITEIGVIYLSLEILDVVVTLFIVVLDSLLGCVVHLYWLFQWANATPQDSIALCCCLCCSSGPGLLFSAYSHCVCLLPPLVALALLMLLLVVCAVATVAIPLSHTNQHCAFYEMASMRVCWPARLRSHSSGMGFLGHRIGYERGRVARECRAPSRKHTLQSVPLRAKQNG